MARPRKTPLGTILLKNCYLLPLALEARLAREAAIRRSSKNAVVCLALQQMLGDAPQHQPVTA